MKRRTSRTIAALGLVVTTMCGVPATAADAAESDVVVLKEDNYRAANFVVW
jgi:hypothetical protein